MTKFKGEPLSLERILDTEEQAVMDKITETMQAIIDLPGGLVANAPELASAVHVMQGFVVQHALHRLDPANWSSWYGIEIVDLGPNVTPDQVERYREQHRTMARARRESPSR